MAQLSRLTVISNLGQNTNEMWMDVTRRAIVEFICFLHMICNNKVMLNKTVYEFWTMARFTAKQFKCTRIDPKTRQQISNRAFRAFLLRVDLPPFLQTILEMQRVFEGVLDRVNGVSGLGPININLQYSIGGCSNIWNQIVALSQKTGGGVKIAEWRETPEKRILLPIVLWVGCNYANKGS